MQKVLLPVGFHDVLPPFAAAESKTVAKLLGVFEQWGYQQVKPPMAEFEESLVGSSKRLSKQTFRVVDPFSHRMMGIRTDMTMQVARMVQSRFDSALRPLRLSYAGQVLRVEGEGLHGERQLSQVGAELIGLEGPDADAEIILLAVDALSQLKIGAISIDFSMPMLANDLLQNTGLDAEEHAALQQAVDRKDVAAIRSCKSKQAKLIASLVSLAGPAKKMLPQISSLKLSAAAQKQVAELREVVKRVEAAQSGITITIDPLERRGFDYQSGIGFTFFSTDASLELGRGSRYSLGDAKSNLAVGFSLSVNALMRALPKPKAKDYTLVPKNTPYATLQALHQKGVRTILSSGKCDELEAKALGCNAIFKNGKSVAVKTPASKVSKNRK